MTMLTTKKRKSKSSQATTSSVWSVEQHALETAVKLIEDAKNNRKKKSAARKKTKKEIDDSVNVRVKNVDSSSNSKFCLKSRVSDIRLLRDRDLLIREMRSAFRRWDWNTVVDLLVYAARTNSQHLLSYAHACFPVLAMQHPALKTQGRELIVESLFAAGISNPTEFTNRLFTWDDGEDKEKDSGAVVDKLFSSEVRKRKKREEEELIMSSEEDDDVEEGEAGNSSFCARKSEARKEIYQEKELPSDSSDGDELEDNVSLRRRNSESKRETYQEQDLSSNSSDEEGKVDIASWRKSESRRETYRGKEFSPASSDEKDEPKNLPSDSSDEEDYDDDENPGL